MRIGLPFQFNNPVLRFGLEIAYFDLPDGAPISGVVVKAAIEKMEFAHALLELMMMGELLPQANSTQDLLDTLRMAFSSSCCATR